MESGKILYALLWGEDSSLALRMTESARMYEGVISVEGLFRCHPEGGTTEGSILLNDASVSLYAFSHWLVTLDVKVLTAAGILLLDAKLKSKALLKGGSKMKQNLMSVRWDKDKVILLDQTKLPLETVFLEIDNIQDMWDAIKKLIVRGAPAIGIAGAFGLYLGIRNCDATNYQSFSKEFQSQVAYLATSRPTAVNLFWALDRMEQVLLEHSDKSIAEIKQLLLQEAQEILREDEYICQKIGEHGLTLLKDGMTILTHCNAGSYATARYGTALAPVYLAQEKGWTVKVFADETRPLLQGARLTAHELMMNGIDVTLITDSMAAYVMQKGWIDAVIVGADRVAANGDTANKIGTYGLAILAKEHGIPFYVACPISTIDLKTASGEEIVIEERGASEIIQGFGKVTAPPDVKVFNPAFDVTPHKYITAFITEKGIIYPSFKANLSKTTTF